jgi:hypothetical protein
MTPPTLPDSFTWRRRTVAVALLIAAAGASAGLAQAATGDPVPGSPSASPTEAVPTGGPSPTESAEPSVEPSASPSPSGAPSGASPAPSAPEGIGELASTCEGSALPQHDGFQNGDRCVHTSFGEVGSAATNPSLLIARAPQTVRVNRPFMLKVSTRNLVRDRFLPAGRGGYYKESSLLGQDGLVRGHFHTACRMLPSVGEAPAPEPVPAFFVATEDGKGGRDADVVTVRVTGMPVRGVAQCAVWAGDGSHRVPMMQRANQVPAFDAVRIVVR